MSRDARRVLISSGLYTLVVIVLLIGGGLYVRSIIAASFDAADRAAALTELARTRRG